MKLKNLLDLSYLGKRFWPVQPMKLLIDKAGQTFDQEKGAPVVCPKFRNDDVSWDTPPDRFREFCRLFWKFNLKQVHGITLNGSTRTLFLRNGEPVQYEGAEDLAKMPNPKIRELARNEQFEQRTDIIRFLADSVDDIALHGLFHTDYSVMEPDEQRNEIREGLSILRGLFPRKNIRYFIAPFNRVNATLESVCRETGLELLAEIGEHLEAKVRHVRFCPDTWYRYHHHRFYPESTFSYYKLSLGMLKGALSRNFKVVAAMPQGTGTGRD